MAFENEKILLYLYICKYGHDSHSPPILARFQIERGYPSLWFINTGGKQSEAHYGPRDLGSLMEFVNDHMGRGPPNEKVRCKYVLVNFMMASNYQLIIFKNFIILICLENRMLVLERVFFADGSRLQEERVGNERWNTV